MTRGRGGSPISRGGEEPAALRGGGHTPSALRTVAAYAPRGMTRRRLLRRPRRPGDRSDWLAAGGRGWARRATHAAGIGGRRAVTMVTGRGGRGVPGSGAMAAMLLLLLAAATVAGRDDSDWVRLPSKCEGKRGWGWGWRGPPSEAVVIGRRVLAVPAWR